jgi:hypothetical protein
MPESWSALGLCLPLLRLDGAAPSAPERLRRSLDVLAGRLGMTSGAFAT